jgi:uncharacterized protein (DUF2141 family)
MGFGRAEDAVRAAALILLSLAAQAQGAGPVLGGDAQACTSGVGPAVLATITGLKDRRGEVRLELYPANEQDFLKDDRDLLREGKLFRRVGVPAPPAGLLALCLRVPRPGRYAILLTHDRDGKNKFNIWSDGAGTPSNAKMGRAKPKLRDAIVDVPAGVRPITIKAQYLRGLSGFSPVAD